LCNVLVLLVCAFLHESLPDIKRIQKNRPR